MWGCGGKGAVVQIGCGSIGGLERQGGLDGQVAGAPAVRRLARVRVLGLGCVYVWCRQAAATAWRHDRLGSAKVAMQQTLGMNVEWAWVVRAV